MRNSFPAAHCAKRLPYQLVWLLAFWILAGESIDAMAQNIPLNLRSSRANRRVGLHNGNRVRTKFQNDGLIGSKTFIAPLLPTCAWPVDENEYIYDLNIILGVERVFRDTIIYTNNDTTALTGRRLRDNQIVTIPRGRLNTTIRNIVVNGQRAADVTAVARYVTTHQGPRGGGYRIVNGQFEGLQPVEGFFNPAEEFPAMSHIPSSWPDRWPDQPTWINPATGKADWNGYFGRGVFNADQESYFVFDDATDRRWFEEFGFRPTSDPNRYGVGFQVKARGLQWSSFLAQDNIFWLYEIKNISDYDYDKVVFGSVVGTAVGRQFQRNVSVFDQSRSITYTWNPVSETNLRPDPTAVDGAWNRNFPVGYVGVAFLESPGNPFDGIDNDDDWNKIGSGPFAIPNRGTPSQFAAIPVGQISPTGYDFYEFVADVQRGIFRGENAPRVIRGGDILITINDTLIQTPARVAAGYTEPYTVSWRRAVTMPASGSITITSQGITRTISVGDTLREITGDLIDNNLNGIIDEDYRLHFRRTRLEADIVTGRSRIILLPPLRFINYIQLARNGENLNDPTRFPMIDERRDDGLDNNGNWTLLDDVGTDGRPGTGDRGENNATPTTGESAFDATDVVEADQIGLTSYKFDLSASPQMGNSDDLWRVTTPGVFDTLDLVPKDGDYTYGTGYFPLKRGQTERLSIALVFGQTADEILTNKDIVQEIYDNNYNFAGPPRPAPRLSAIPGDRRVTLYWTSEAEDYFDVFINRRIVGAEGTRRDPRAFTFEGYKIYKSTDPQFSDARVISGGQGEQRFRLAPIAQFDKINGVFGYFPLVGRGLSEQSRGVAFYLGKETGLTHTFTDTDVENGRTYYYAVAAYSRGYIPFDTLYRISRDSVIVVPNPAAAIPPSENSIGGFIDGRGRLLLSPNTVAVTPRAEQAGLRNNSPSSDTLRPSALNRGSGRVIYDLINPRKIDRDRRIQVEFRDTSNDGIDNDGDGLLDAADPDETLEPRTSFFRVLDITNPSRPDTLLRQSGIINGVFQRFLGNPALYQQTQEGDLFYRATEETALIDKIGTFFTIVNVPETRLDRAFWRVPGVRTIFEDTVPRLNAFTAQLLAPSIRGRAIRKPAEYAIVMRPGRSSPVNLIVDGVLTSLPARNTNFQVINLLTGQPERFFLDPATGSEIGEFGVNLSICEQPEGSAIDTLFSWNINISPARYFPKPGDTLFIRTKRPITAVDRFTVELKAQTEDPERVKSALDNIKVFPNPYIVTNTAEGNLVGADTRGRAARKIFFKNVPLRSTIRIYTIRGELIRTLYADNPDGNTSFGKRDRENEGVGTFSYPTSQVEWDLKTSENLDVAYGIYLYHVDAPGIGTKTGKFAVIK
ncbi:MAG: hypothetical protein NZM05_06495 [Chloroherpetonaceae bacterium]|nr:hypothetical protein [Chloroherpetonaceae bacterium]